MENTRAQGRLLQKVKGKDNCWICEGWNECKFDIRTRIFGAEVSLHFDFDDYRPDLMTQGDAGIYSTHRMVPAGIHKFFFSVNGEFILSPMYNQVHLEVSDIKSIENKINHTFPGAKLPFNLR